MFPEQLKKILGLIKRTGDRVVIFDSNEPENSYVVMDLERYTQMTYRNQPADKIVPEPVKVEKTENLSGNSDLSDKKENLTEEDLTDKINREISMWKNRENAPYLAEDNKPKKPWSIPSNVKDKAQEIE